MRIKLPESVRPRQRAVGSTAVSTLVHGLLIGGTVVATGYTAEQVAQPPEPGRLVYVVPERTPPQAPRPRESRQPLVPTNVDVPVPVIEAPPIDLSVVPSGLPPVSALIGTIRQEEFSSVGRDSLPAGPVQPATGEPWSEYMVEKPVRARSGNPSPRYPSLLANAGVEGAVYAQFVVDTTGRVEVASIRFTKSDHPLFERVVRDVLLRSRYVPAEAGGRRVRQLVEQGFAFEVRRKE